MRGFRKTSLEAIWSRARGRALRLNQPPSTISRSSSNFGGSQLHFGQSKVVGNSLFGERGEWGFQICPLAPDRGRARGRAPWLKPSSRLKSRVSATSRHGPFSLDSSADGSVASLLREESQIFREGLGVALRSLVEPGERPKRRRCSLFLHLPPYVASLVGS